MGDVGKRGMWKAGGKKGDGAPAAAGTENGDVAPSSDQTGKGIFPLLDISLNILPPAPPCPWESGVDPQEFGFNSPPAGHI